MKEAMKKLEIIVKGNQLRAIQELLDRTEVSGYTMPEPPPCLSTIPTSCLSQT